jgi:hypothetical protein
MLAIILGSVLSIDEGIGVVLVGQRARNRVLELMPRELGPGQWERTRKNLDRLFNGYDPPENQTEKIAAFVREVVPLLEDDRLTPEEVEHINGFIREELLDLEN